MSVILGIDLRTTNSAAAVWRNGAPAIISNPDGEHLTPSVVAVDGEEIVVGRRARQLRIEHPDAAVYSIKRFIGRRLDETVVQDDLHQMRILYTIGSSPNRGGIEVTLGNRHLTPQQLSAHILRKLKRDAETILGHPVTEAVITVPAYFHDSQRQATRDAGLLAGLNVKRVINEPTAACLAFAHRRLLEPRRTVAVFDLGGGTFDVSILEIGKGPFRVRSTHGDTHLGGDDFDWAIVEWVIASLPPADQATVRADASALSRLAAAAERAKVALSTQDSARLQVTGALGSTTAVRDLDVELTQANLDQLAAPLISRALNSCQNALNDARLQPQAIREVLMVGGQTRMPAVRAAVRQFFGIEPNVSVDPDEVVALGAAVQAAILNNEATGLMLADVTPLSLGVNTVGKMDQLIPRNSPVPFEVSRLYSTVSDKQETVDIQIYQGESPLVANNIRLGTVQLRGIEPAPAGQPEINVTFHVDPDGILHVSARNVRTGVLAEVTITDSLRLSDEDIAAQVREAEAYGDRTMQTNAESPPAR